ncbi:hypothetical protein AKO1_005487 [Acrasis kona]|uniref:NmrA-like domain-containing protein n=1 Tax=Acrasis kona TaxID=1008807 RepID=A0AAW2ZJF4_9EUKA
MQLITVVGATGRQGGSVVDYLLKNDKRWKVRATTRNTNSEKSDELRKKGVEVVECNLDVYEQVKNAFKGSYGVFMMTDYWQAKEKEVEQGKNMCKAALEEKVTHVVWTSLYDADAITSKQLYLPHYQNKAEVEKYLKNECSSIPIINTAIVGFYFSNLSTWFQPEQIGDNEYVFRQPISKETTLPTYDVNDTGKVVAKLFEHPEKYTSAHAPIPLVSQNLTITDICNVLNKVKGVSIKHEPQSYEEFGAHNMPETTNNMKWYEFYKDHIIQAEKENRVVDMLTFEDWLKSDPNRITLK